MTMVAGARIGVYEVLGPLGAGGMGEVYRARDTRLKREVALKVLPDVFANDSDRLARFAREAELLAALNHPNIAAIHGLEEATAGATESGATLRALVMELVEGETLADRLLSGPIPHTQARSIARQIAEALEAAHEQGIIHRDLKPANIKIREDGTVKVLDFGLAKLAEPDGVQSSASATLSPTITSPALMTNAGVLLGTAAYMSPEQAKGRPADKRSDVWSFGCVLFEMLTARRPFEGADILETVAAVLKSTPDWSSLPQDLPGPMRSLVSRCLERERRARIGDFSTILFLLNEAESGRPGSVDDASARVSNTRRLVTWTVAAAAVGVVLGAGILTWVRREPASAPVVSRFSIPLPPDQQITGTGRHTVAISPGGTHIVYTANDRMYLRPINSLEATPIRGTEGARSPFFSPDGQSIGFWQPGQLKRVAVTGGAPVTITATLNPLGAHWEADGSILFGHPNGIMKVSAAGGMPELIVKGGPGERFHGPRLLPGGRAVLFTSLAGDDWNDAQLVVESLDDHRRVVVMSGGTDGQYLPTGHLVYVNNASLLAIPFDPKTFTTTGGPVSIVENVIQPANGPTGAAMFAVSQNGSIVYLRGFSLGTESKRLLTWVDRQGQATSIDSEARPYVYPRIAPDAARLAVTLRDQQRDLWIMDFARKTFARFTLDASDDRYSTWTPNSNEILFGSNRDRKIGVWTQGADQPGTARLIATSPSPEAQNLVPTSVAPDGSVAVVGTASPGATISDIFALPLKPGSSPGADQNGKNLRPLIATPAIERNGEISPDGKWLAYESNESGTFQVYVRAWANPNGAVWQVSTSAGITPAWAPKGQPPALFYVIPTIGGLMHVRVSPGDTWKASPPEKLFDGPYSWTVQGYAGRQYDVAPDGRRFVFMKPADAPANQPAAMVDILVVLNWFEELKRQVPMDR